MLLIVLIAVVISIRKLNKFNDKIAINKVTIIIITNTFTGCSLS